MSDNAVCRTAPATPGLLNIQFHCTYYLGRVSLDGVEDVDEDEEDGDEQAHPAGDALGVDEEADPADHHEQAGGEVEGDDVETHFPGKHQLEAGNTATRKQLQVTVGGLKKREILG